MSSDEEIARRQILILYQVLPIVVEESKMLGEPWSETMKKVDSILDKINEYRRVLNIIK